jgi:acetyl esterase/lipase
MSSPTPAPGTAAAPAPHVVEDCLGFVQLLSDSTVRRSTDYSMLRPIGRVPSDSDVPVQWKDVVYDDTHGLRLRMYRPTGAAAGAGKKKLPVLVYFHGGGFCLLSFEMTSFHAGALRLAAELPALVLSADYRLAPEHRLPAALDDAESVFSWLRTQATSTSSAAGAGADPWLAESADLNRVFVSGDSAGGNISHHVAVRHGSERGLALAPLRLAGCVMLWPYFGGEEPTPSEAACPADQVMGPALFDQMWRLALPAGATKDHPFANPFAPGSVPLGDLGAAFPPVLVVDPDQDPLHDRVVDYVARLKAAGKAVELVVFAGQGHGFFITEPCGEASDELIRVIRRFVHGA